MQCKTINHAATKVTEQSFPYKSQSAHSKPFESEQKHPLKIRRLEKTKCYVTYNTNSLLCVTFSRSESQKQTNLLLPLQYVE